MTTTRDVAVEALLRLVASAYAYLASSLVEIVTEVETSSEDASYMALEVESEE